MRFNQKQLRNIGVHWDLCTNYTKTESCKSSCPQLYFLVLAHLVLCCASTFGCIEILELWRSAKPTKSILGGTHEVAAILRATECNEKVACVHIFMVRLYGFDTYITNMITCINYPSQAYKHSAIIYLRHTIPNINCNYNCSAWNLKDLLHEYCKL